jgi:alanine racemase
MEARLAAAGLPPLPRAAWARVDLDALAANLTAIRAVAGPRVRVEPVVKADAYGHGAVPIARELATAGADGFCVAAYDEAVELREAGIEAPILVLYPVPPDLVGDAVRRGIAVSAGDPVHLERTLAAAVADPSSRPAAGAPGERRLSVELEMETGLGRSGFDDDGLLAAAARVGATPGASLAGIWTHLQAPEDHPRTARQIERFEVACSRLAESRLAPSRRHVAASGAIALGSVLGYDAIRPGLMVYGILPEEVPPAVGPLASLRPVLSVHARPVRVMDLPAGWGISYGPTFETTRPSRIATLPVGYGDGWPRALSNRGEALVRGVRAPLVGTVSMDAVMVDVTDVPGPAITIEDEFVLLGRQGADQISAAELARRRGSISWEVVTAIARRMPRVYDSDAGPVGIRTLMSAGIVWRASSSGTATSATWRSTRS